MGLSLILASVSWAGFTLSRTILDPGGSERLADQLLDNPDVRAALVTRLADSLESQLPPDVPIPRQVVEGGAATALDDPRVESLVRDGFVQVHQNALAGDADPVVVDANALGAAGRDVLVETRPELDQVLPAAPALELELPTTGLSWIGTVKDTVDRATLWTGIAAIAGAVLAFVVARNRGAVLRRVAYWGYGTAAFWLVIGYAIPWLAGMLSPTSAAIATAIVDVFFGAMIQPALALVVFATIMLLASFLVPAVGRRRGASKLQPRINRQPDGYPATAGSGASATPYGPDQGRRQGAPTQGTQPVAYPTAQPTARPPTTPVRTTAGPGYESTQVMPIPVAPEPGPGEQRTTRMGPETTRMQPQPGLDATAPWHEGQGYADEQRSNPLD